MENLQKKPRTTISQKHHIVQFILQNSINGRPRRGAFQEAATKFGFYRRTIYTIWSDAKQQIEGGKVVQFQSKKVGMQHRDKLIPDVEKIKKLSVLERSTIRKMAPKIGVSKTTLERWIQSKYLRAHTSAIKPQISDANKLARLKFSLSQLMWNCQGERKIMYQNMQNIIHIDEKWFYMTKTTDRYYLLPSEDDPYRSCQSKRFITKIMFMCAVGRPQFDSTGAMTFDGKIGIFPFTTQEPAKRNSKNRGRGTLVTKPIQSITKDVIKDCIINQIIPAIKPKWPSTSDKNIQIQQDNAKPHFQNTDTDFIVAATSDGFNMQLICQPPNSPDMNINDLGFFRAIQSLQDDKCAKNVDDLLSNVVSSFDELTPQTLNNVFLTLQSCYTEVMKVKGGNSYKIPHMNKAKLLRQGILPQVIEVEEGLLRECVEYLLQPENDVGSNIDLIPLMNHLGY